MQLIASPDGQFHDGNPATGALGTFLSAAWHNAVQAEIVAPITAAGMPLDPNNNGQLLAAILTLIEARAGNYLLDTGGANACVVATNPPTTAYGNGLSIKFRVAHSVTGPSTLNVGPSAVSLLRDDGTPTQNGDAPAGSILSATFDTTANGFLINSVVPSQIEAQVAAILAGTPVLGAATAQTPPQFDNSSKLATTAFAMSVGLRGAPIVLTGGGTLAPSTVGSVVALTAQPSVMGYQTVLPSLSSVPAGSMYQFINVSPYGMTLSRQGSDSLTVSGPTMTTFFLNPGDSVFVQSLMGTWIISGSGALYKSSSFTASGLVNGYFKLPSGIIIQWGIGSANSAGVINSFPIIFPTSCWVVLLGAANGNGPWTNGTQTQSGFVMLQNIAGTSNHFWMAIGN